VRPPGDRCAYDRRAMVVHDVIVIGAGPAGLATAIAAKKAGLSAVALEKGVLVNSLFHFPTHMVFFTTPELLEIGGLPFVTPTRSRHAPRRSGTTAAWWTPGSSTWSSTRR